MTKTKINLEDDSVLKMLLFIYSSSTVSYGSYDVWVWSVNDGTCGVIFDEVMSQSIETNKLKS